MIGLSYGFRNLLVKMEVAGWTSSYEEVMTVGDFLKGVADFVLLHPGYFPPPRGVNDVCIPTMRPQWVGYLSVYLRDYVFKGETPRAIKEALPENLLLKPIIYCALAPEWIAIRLTVPYTMEDLAKIHQLPAWEEGGFPFCYWAIGYRSGPAISWYDHVEGRFLAEIDQHGTISMTEGLTFSAGEWPWPLPLMSMSQEMRAYGILQKLLKPGDANPLTNLIGSPPPYRGVGFQISEEIRRAFEALRRTY